MQAAFVPLGVSTITVRNVLSVTIARASVVSSATNPQEGYLTQLWVSVCVCVHGFASSDMKTLSLGTRLA